NRSGPRSPDFSARPRSGSSGGASATGLARACSVGPGVSCSFGCGWRPSSRPSDPIKGRPCTDFLFSHPKVPTQLTPFPRIDCALSYLSDGKKLFFGPNRKEFLCESKPILLETTSFFMLEGRH
ncbi:unnamed protein product, partial [Amoebophrya sp. A120]